jgi:hypothetical protein
MTDLPRTDHWTPITDTELHTVLQQIEQLPDSQRQLWHLVRLPWPELWQQHPWGDEGCGFWVVAVAGKRCLYYNDLSGHFCQSSFERWGQIDHFDPDGQPLPQQLQSWLTLLADRSKVS